MSPPAGRAPAHRPSTRGAGGRALAAAALAVLLGFARGAVAAPAPAVISSTDADSELASGSRLLPARVSVRPDHVRLGEPLRLRAWVLLPRAVRARWLPPDSGGAITWGAPAARRAPGTGDRDTLLFESGLQIFTPGPVSVPGPRIQLDGGRGARRLPSVTVTVEPSPGVADSSARLHALRAPLEAPWWERVPWTTVALTALLIAALIAAWRGLRRRRPAQVVARAAAGPPRDPAELTLEELEALRRLRLPQAGRHADHALALTRIARRFLEATAGTPRPGDSTPELVSHLEAARLEADQLARVAALLRAWDQVKFARQPATLDESERGERTVEEMARRRLRELRPAETPASPPGERVA